MTDVERAIDALVGEADRAAAHGDMPAARRALEAAAAQAPPGFDLAMKLAALRRAARDPAAALDAVTAALAHRPLDLLALLLRAHILEELGSGEAGEAYGRALAQLPEAGLPAAMDGVVRRARERYRHHVEQRGARFREAMAPWAGGADPDERERLARFRTNVLRETRVYHSEPVRYHYPGLVEREFHPRGAFPWLAAVEAATDRIAAEFQAVMRAERAELVPYVQYAADVPTRQWEALNHSRDWTAIHLHNRGERVEANSRHCPETMALLGALPQPRILGRGPNAMFSLLAPGTRIPPHHGVANTRLVCHLPLVVPDGCWFRVGAETRAWRRGEAFVFDDTIEHEAANDGPELRAVLIFDVWHPGLGEREQGAVAALMAAEEDAPLAAL